MTSRFKIVLVWLVLSASVLVMSYSYEFGRMSSDSTEYLQVAQSIATGRGLWLPDVLSDNQKIFPAKRPLGYPFLIAGVSWIFQVDVFWGAKLVNIILAAILLLLLYRSYVADAWVFGLVLFTASTLNIWSMTWSEVPFIIGLVGLALALDYYHRLEQKRWLALAIFWSWWLFLMRYAGIFAGAVLLILSFYYLYYAKRQRFFRVLFSSAVIFLGMAVYLAINFAFSGTLTGLHARMDASSGLSVGKKIVRHLVNEGNILIDGNGLYSAIIGLLFYSLLIIYFFRLSNLRQNISSRTWFFVAVGTVHFLLVSFWDIKQGGAERRLLTPTMVLWWLAILDILRNYPRSWRIMRPLLLTFVFMSLILNIPAKIAYHAFAGQLMAYPKSVQALRLRYQSVPSGSIVAFADSRLRYLRPDLGLVYLSPEELRISVDEYYTRDDKWDMLLKILCESDKSSLYVDTRKAQQIANDDKSLKYWLSLYVSDNIIKANTCSTVKNIASR